MRELKQHIVPGDSVNHQVKIEVLDQPGAGGACHDYVIKWTSKTGATQHNSLISFQNGPIKEAGVNGVTHEALLAIIIDRLEHFQAGPFKSDMNAAALLNCRHALECLQERTIERIARGVEGTHSK